MQTNDCLICLILCRSSRGIHTVCHPNILFRINNKQNCVMCTYYLINNVKHYYRPAGSARLLCAVRTTAYNIHCFSYELRCGENAVYTTVYLDQFHVLLIPETRQLCQYSVPGSKHTFSKLRSLSRLFPISLDCLPGFWLLLFSFYALSNDT